MTLQPKADPTGARRGRRFVRQVHRWLGLLIAIQILLWVSGGLIMSALELEAVRGEHLAAKAEPVPLNGQGRFVPLQDILLAERNAIRSVTLTTLLGEPVYRLEAREGVKLLDARTGQSLSPIPEATARAIALNDYAGPAAIAGVDWVDSPAPEYRGRDLPLWRVRFADERETALYISPSAGQVVARRNDLWRVFDFVWMLHIMDYEEREDFNHPLLVTTAATTLLFVISGLFMLVYSFRPRRLP